MKEKGAAVTTQQTSTVQVPGARTAPDASAKRDARSAAALPGRALPLGATPGERFGKAGTNFAIASSVAEGVTLCLFDENGAETQIPLLENDAEVWHAFVPGVGHGQRPWTRRRACAAIRQAAPAAPGHRNGLVRARGARP